MNDLQINRVEDCMNWLIEGEVYTHSQSINFLIDKMGELSVSLAFVNNQMAIAKRIYNDKKKMLYLRLVASNIANQEYFSASLAKDYINARLATDQYNFDLCERCSRTMVHQLDSLRTAISALKLEYEYKK